MYEQIWDDADVNAWVICWSEDQDTGFHDHDLSAAAIAVISGAVREDRMRLGSGPLSRVIGAGSSFTVPPVAIHRVMHAGGAPAVTIHAYSPPLTRTGVYRVGDGGELQRQSLRSSRSCEQSHRSAETRRLDRNPRRPERKSDEHDRSTSSQQRGVRRRV